MQAHTPTGLSGFEVVRNRREPASHPGPAIARDYLAPLGLDAATLAPHVGMEPARLGRMLAGLEAIDVESAIRLGRALQLNPKTLVERQARHDFSRLRRNAAIETIPVLPDEGRVVFPETGFLRGRLAGLPQNTLYGGVRDETLAFFADDGEGGISPESHPLETGAKLRVYDTLDHVAWVGVILQTLEGRPLLPFVRPNEWINWFATRRRADYAPPR
jgi:addiction module HigA family antidote